MEAGFDGVAKIMTIVMPIIMLFGGYWITKSNNKNAQDLKIAADIANQNALQANKNAEDAAKQARMVSRTLATTSAESVAAREQQDNRMSELTMLAKDTFIQGDKIHTLVNSNMGAQLQVSMAALKRIADLTNDPSDRLIAENAEKLFHEHEDKQATVDQKAGVNQGIILENLRVTEKESEDKK
jgi:hypothetical protein